MRIKRITSLLLLGIFLFAYSEKGVHDLFHSSDGHCHSLTDKHIHNLEHHCFLCDFDVFSVGRDSKPVTFSLLSETKTIIFLPAVSGSGFYQYTQASLRGPPSFEA